MGMQEMRHHHHHRDSSRGLPRLHLWCMDPVMGFLVLPRHSEEKIDAVGINAIQIYVARTVDERIFYAQIDISFQQIVQYIGGILL